jgi:hypothetical protein
LETTDPEEAEYRNPPAAEHASVKVGPRNGEPSRLDRLERHEPLLDVAIVFILAVASVATAWSGYQSTRWSGVQASSYVQASSSRVESSKQYTYAHQLSVIDVSTFTGYIDARFGGDTALADYYINHFRADFRPAFDAWMATDPFNNPDSPANPFQMPEYALPQLKEADRLSAQADALFQKGQDANQTSDDYVLNTVFLAAVLFFTAFAPRVRWFPARFALVLFAVAIFSFGIYHLIVYPIE